MIHKGLAQHRFKDNPIEKEFALAWGIKQEFGSTLQYLLSPTNMLHDSTMTQRDATVAATVIQWLGSPVGQSFLRNIEKGVCK